MLQEPQFILEDTSLRDGEQSPGIAFSREHKFAIHDALVDAGVRWIEVGIPAMGGEELDTLSALLARGSEANLVAWNRGVKEDVAQSIALGFKAIHIGLPTSTMHLNHSINKDRKWLLAQSADLIKFAKDKGVFVSISAEDVGRTEIDFLKDYASHVAAAGADRLRLSDTIGILTPERYAEIISAIKNEVSINLQCHAHNDFGLATANTLAGLRAGATFFHATVNGIGERAGMPDIAQVVMALKQLYNIDVGVHTEKLKALSLLVQQITKTACPPWQPIVGNNIFSHESGIHANGTLRHGSSFEPFAPELVAGERRIVIGKHTGRAAINHVLKRYNINASDKAVTLCLTEIRAKAMRDARSLTDGELLQIYHQAAH